MNQTWNKFSILNELKTDQEIWRNSETYMGVKCGQKSSVSAYTSLTEIPFFIRNNFPHPEVIVL